MSAPFLKPYKDGYRVSFAKALYPSQAMAQLKELYAEHDVAISEKGGYFELSLSAFSEEDSLDLVENFLRLAKNVKRE